MHVYQFIGFTTASLLYRLWKFISIPIWIYVVASKTFRQSSVLLWLNNIGILAYFHLISILSFFPLFSNMYTENPHCIFIRTCMFTNFLQGWWKPLNIGCAHKYLTPIFSGINIVFTKWRDKYVHPPPPALSSMNSTMHYYLDPQFY